MKNKRPDQARQIYNVSQNMKTQPIKLLALFTVASLVASNTFADEALRTKIIKERDTILSQILTERESGVATGLVDENAVLSARLALFSFRRDTASSKVEKVKQQELIVSIYQKKLATLKGRVEAGVGGREDVLLATDSLLQAQQMLEELKLDAEKG